MPPKPAVKRKRSNINPLYKLKGWDIMYFINLDRKSSPKWG